jgi:hypothetical protein
MYRTILIDDKKINCENANRIRVTLLDRFGDQINITPGSHLNVTYNQLLVMHKAIMLKTFVDSFENRNKKQ